MKKMAVVLTMLLVFCRIAFADYPYGGVCPSGPGGKVGGYVYSKCSETDNKFPCDLWLSSKDGSYFVDTWKFAQCNCTSYAAYMLNFYGITDFNNSYLGEEWHDGKSWGGAASSAGIKVDKNPIPGDIAYWDEGTYGHVAWVEEVHYDSNGKATEVEISEYNFDITYGFGKRTISASNPTGYIHILAYNEAVAETYYLDCYEMDKLCTTQTKEEWGVILKKVWSDYRCKNCTGNYSAAYIDTLSKAIGGMGGGPGTENLPIEPKTPDLPDFHIKKLWLETYWGYETYTYGTSESIKIRTLTENIGEAKPESDVEMRWYLSKGYKVDRSSEWIHIETASTPKENLSPGETASETETFSLAQHGVTPGIWNIVVCADRIRNEGNENGNILEEHESNNCSTEAVFEVKDDSLAPINRPTHDFIVTSLELTNTPLPMSVDGYYGAKVLIRNIGTKKPDTDIRIAYEINGPSTNYQWVAVDYDSISNEDLYPKQDHLEGIYASVHAPTVPGIYSFRVRADCDNVSQETNEDNNTAVLQFEVKPLPSIIVTRPTSGVEWSSEFTKHIEWTANNFPAPGYVSVEYSMDNGISWRIIETSTHNDGGLNWDMCKYRTTDSRQSYIRIRSVEYPSIFGVSPRFYINHKRGCK